MTICSSGQTVNPTKCGEETLQLPFHKQGVTILGTPLGHPAFVQAQLSEKVAEHATLLERIPQMQDLQAHDFLRQLARARARWEPPEIRQAARRAWFRRWSTALACCAAQAFALSLLERRGGHGVDGEVPSTCDVIWDDRRGG